VHLPDRALSGLAVINSSLEKFPNGKSPLKARAADQLIGYCPASRNQQQSRKFPNEESPAKLVHLTGYCPASSNQQQCRIFPNRESPLKARAADRVPSGDAAIDGERERFLMGKADRVLSGQR
jgi:hypothetical protein